MDFQAQSSEARFSAYVEGLVSVIGHADRARPLRDYCLGLMLPCERKSVEPMAAVTAPERVGAQHQSLLHFVNQAPWSDEKVLGKVREMVVPALERHGPIEAWIIDDTGLPKKGRHSVGVGRQYCGQLGKQDNCQVAVSLSIANHHASLPADVAAIERDHSSGPAVSPETPREHVVPNHPVSRTYEVRGHRGPHDPQANDANRCSHSRKFKVQR